MTAHIQLDEGSSQKYTETVEVTAGIHRQVMHLAGISACALKKTKTVSQNITIGTPNADHTIPNALQSWTKYVTVYCASPFIIAMGESTIGPPIAGVYVGPGMPTSFPVTYTGVANDDKVHVQCATAGAIVRVTEMVD
jgi:hypothetical protein